MTRAVIARAEGAPPEIVEVVLPELTATDVRVRIVAAGVCHTDLSFVNGTIVPEFPVILGHEASGEVVETGDAVTRFSVFLATGHADQFLPRGREVEEIEAKRRPPQGWR